MANTIDLMTRSAPSETSTPTTSSGSSHDLVMMAEKVFHNLQHPDQIRRKLSEILDIARDKLDQIIITPEERQGANVAHNILTQFLRGTLADKTLVLSNTRNLSTVIGRGGDIPLSRAVNTGVNALLKRHMSH